MKPLMTAALVVQLTAAGGAGSGRASERSEAGSSPKDVGRHFSALKGEISSLSQQFREAKERRKREAEQKKREMEGFYEPQAQPTASGGATAGGSTAR